MALKELMCAVIILNDLLVISATWNCAISQPCTCEGNIINCKQRGLDKVPPITNSLYIYDELTLAGNKITSLNGFAFKGLLTKKLDLSNNKIVSISNETFNGLQSSLRVLLLEVDGMLELPTAAINALPHLETLWLKGFNLGVMPDYPFWSLSRLSDLSMLKCNITSLSRNSFIAHNSTLKSLNLNSNSLQSIPKDGLTALKNLKKLFLVQNKLTSVNDNDLDELTSLEDLDLSHNSIASVSANAFIQVKNTLLLLALHINILSSDGLQPIRALKHLHQLNLAYNQITNIPTGLLSEMSNLAFLNVQGNQLSSLSSRSFSGTEHSLHTLLLTENRLTEIQKDTFLRFTELHTLHLDNMPLDNVLYSTVFRGLEESLNTLYIDNAKLTDSAWSSVKRLGKLELLSLSDNQLTVIPDYAVQSMPGLKTLNVGGNTITSISQKSLLGSHASLRTLDVHDNDIKTIDRCTLSGFENLRSLVLSGNPLHCDCKLKWLREWVDDHYDDFTIRSVSWRCGSPDKYKWVLFRIIKAANLTCAGTYTAPQCIDIATTVSPDMTTPSSVMIKVVEATSASILVNWTVSETLSSSIKSFVVEYREVQSSVRTQTEPIPKTQPQYRVENLKHSTSYLICVVLIKDDSTQISRGDYCIQANTTAPHGGGNQTGNNQQPSNLPLILGAVLGILAVVVCICIVAFLFVRRRNNLRESKESAGRLPTREEMPQFGYGSKRFVKTKSRTSDNMDESSTNAHVPNNNGVSATGASASAFSIEDRDRTLNMMTNSAGADRASQRYVPELPPRKNKGPRKPPEGIEDDHIYDEILYVDMNHI